MCNWWFVIIGLGIIFIASVVTAIILSATYNENFIPILSAIFSAIFITLSAPMLINKRIDANKEYIRYKELYEYVMNVVDTMDGYNYANLGITQRILDYNEWLENAKASKETLGNWSIYYDIPVEELEYIGR